MSGFDPVRLALLNARLEGVTAKMANIVLRTGRSGVLSIARDFSCCIVAANGDLLAANDALPIHVLSGPDLMAHVLADLYPELHAGDAFLNNSPYHGCSHAADHTLIAPVVDLDGRHRLTVMVKAHQADIGNSEATTYFAAARDVYHEGALIFPCVRVEESYHINPDFERMCRMRIRVPDQWWGDFLAMRGALRTGERELLALGAEVGWDELGEFQREWFDYSERRMATAIARLPAGRVTRTSRHDSFPGTPADGVPVTATVTVDPAAARIEVDLTDNLDCLPCGLNLSEACSRTGALVGVFNSIDADIPKNAGSFRRVSVRLRENCVVGVPRHPTSTSAATTNLSSRVGNAVQTAFAILADGLGLAECGGAQCPADSVIASLPGDSAPFVNQIFLGSTAGPGGPAADGWLTVGDLGNAGLCNIDSVELDELRQPLHVYERRLLPDTEGAGRRRGAPSVRVVLGPLTRSFLAAYASDGAVNAAEGVRGGGSGAGAQQWMVQADGSSRTLAGCEQVELRPGDRLVSISSGGGGYGAAAERTVDAVAKDVAEGWISSERARAIYRVALRMDGTIDAETTATLRCTETQATPSVVKGDP